MNKTKPFLPTRNYLYPHQYALCFIAITMTSLLLFTSARIAWACDDAFINFRTIQQFFSGNGLRFNLTDRVQAYTSPLWLFLQCLFRPAENNEFINAIALSMILNTCMITALWLHIKELTTFTLATGLMLLSTAVMEFMTSGLEYPLIFFLVILFFSKYISFYKNPSSRALLHISCIAGMMLVTRHDLLITIAFPLAHIAIITQKNKLSCKKSLLILILPLAAWTIFSLVYYGVPFPNTAYAKLGLGNIPKLQILEQGIVYFMMGLQLDPVSIGILIVAILSGITHKNTAFKITSLSILTAVFYILWIGGDFMMGRFYAHLVLLSILLISTLCNQESSIWQKHKKMQFAALAVWILLIAIQPLTPLRNQTIMTDPNIDIGSHRISWERSVWSRFMSLSIYLKEGREKFPYGTPFDEMRQYFSQQKYTENMPIIAIGGASYLAPLDFYINDEIALTDFFRARMPMQYRYWLTAHTSRFYPEGYPAALLDNKVQLTDPNLNAYLQIIKTFTQSDALFTRNRLLTILEFNMGKYDYLLEQATTLPKWEKSEIFNTACTHKWVLERWITRW